MGARSDARDIDRMKREMDGQAITSKPPTKDFREGWERIFGNRLASHRCYNCKQADDDAVMVSCSDGRTICAACYAAAYEQPLSSVKG